MLSIFHSKKLNLFWFLTGMTPCRTRTYFAIVWTSLAWFSAVQGRILLSLERHWHDSVPYQDVFCYRLNVTGMSKWRTRTYFRIVWTSLAWLSGIPGRILLSFDHWHDSVPYQDVFRYRLNGMGAHTKCTKKNFKKQIKTC